MLSIENDKMKDKSAGEEYRTKYEEAKLQEEARRADEAALDCERLLKYINKIAVPAQNVRVLDLGCGTGRLTIEMAKRGYDIYGVDVNGDVINIAREKARNRNVSANFSMALAEWLPFDSNVFDICIADSVLEHVKDPRKTVEEVARILKPGGVAYFDAANGLCPFPTEVKYMPMYGYIPKKIRDRVTSIIVKRFPSLVDYSLTPAQHWFTPTGLRKTLAKAGFKRSWDLFDIITRDEIPSRFRFAGPVFPLLKKVPHLYIRDIMHLPLTAVRLFSVK